MTQTVPFGGKDLRVLLKDSAADTTPDFVAMITTKEIEWVNEFDDATVPAADALDQVPSRRSFLKARAWNTSFSGIADAKGFRILQAAATADLPTYVQILVASCLSTMVGASSRLPAESTAYTASLPGSGADGAVTLFQNSFATASRVSTVAEIQIGTSALPADMSLVPRRRIDANAPTRAWSAACRRTCAKEPCQGST